MAHSSTFLTSSATAEEKETRQSAFKDASFQIDDKVDASSFIADMMMELDAKKVSYLRHEFEQRGELTLSEFVMVMKICLTRENREELSSGAEAQMISSLCELFAQIDINGDGSLEWSEFTSFVVEMGLETQQHKPDGIQAYSFSGAEEIGKARIGKVYYFSGNDSIVTCELDKCVCSVFTNEFVHRYNISREETAGVIQGVVFLDSMDQYAISSSANLLSFHDEHSGHLVKSFRTPTVQVCLEWVDEYMTLYTADRSGVIRAWDLVEMEEKHFMGAAASDAHHDAKSGDDRREANDSGHTDCVMGLLRLDGLEILASASMDCRIGLWDLATGKVRLGSHRDACIQLTPTHGCF